MERAELIDRWRTTLDAPDKSWVLFGNGTCVILVVPEGDLAAQAKALLSKWGPVHAGSSFGDFDIIELESGDWVVTGHHADILTWVGADEVDAGAPDLVVGLLGRAKRGQDAEELQVIHIEDARG